MSAWRKKGQEASGRGVAAGVACPSAAWVRFAAAAALLLALAGSQPAIARRGAASWRDIVTSPDRERLRNWRGAWVLALDQARAEGDVAALARNVVLLDPDAGLEHPEIPAGDYLCRTIKLGRKGMSGPAFMAYPATPCRIADGMFTKTSGAQRPRGRLWPYDSTRLLFLGAMALGDEARALDYGRDSDRDMIGILERIGDRRWRLVLPQPHWESQTDIVEIVPANPSAG